MHKRDALMYEDNCKNKCTSFSSGPKKNLHRDMKGVTLTSLVEEGLAVILAEAKGEPVGSRCNCNIRCRMPPVEALPGIDLQPVCELEEVMDRS